MIPKPRHFERDYAEQFQDQSVVDAYHHRPPYPEAVFTMLAALVDDGCKVVLDVGCGTGEIARRIAPLADRVDAVDFSQAMIAKGRSLPGGDSPNLTWICGPIEAAEPSPPYGLITAAASLHWMDWIVVLPRFRRLLTPSGYLAIIEDSALPTPCPDALWALVRRYSTNRDYQPYNVVEELELRVLFKTVGRRQTAPVSFTQPVSEYIESFHARNGFSRERMSKEAALAFDTEAEKVMRAVFPDGNIVQSLQATVTWGNPL